MKNRGGERAEITKELKGLYLVLKSVRRSAFDKRIDFDVHLIAYKGNADWVEDTLLKIKECLENDAIPDTGQDCDHCTYWNASVA